MSTGDIRFTRMITLANGRASRFSVRVAYTHLDVEVTSLGSVRNENGPKGVAGHETPPGLITGGPRGHRRARWWMRGFKEEQEKSGEEWSDPFPAQVGAYPRICRGGYYVRVMRLGSALLL